jgi:outer membrane lipoprotein carrier protein
MALAISPSIGLAQSSVVEPSTLDRFLDGLTTWRAEFSQQLTDPRGRATLANTGRFLVQRPGRFRWEIRTVNAASSEYTQLLLADGRNLWFYDRELEQVTVKPAAAALGATPLMLLVGDAKLREQFEQRTLARSLGLEWLEIKPKRADAEFREARLAFAGNELRRMVLKDRLGQTATLEFRSSARNVAVASDEFVFRVPAGVDVIGKPLEALR